MCGPVTCDGVARMDEANLRAHSAQRAEWMERAQGATVRPMKEMRK